MQSEIKTIALPLPYRLGSVNCWWPPAPATS